MTKENIKDQKINDETKFNEAEGRTSCENEPCANVAEEQQETANVADKNSTEEKPAEEQIDWRDKYIR